METHRGPYRGPVGAGLPGVLVVVFALVLEVGLVMANVPWPVIAGCSIVAIGLFLMIRRSRRAA
jgi:hypothetical protein